MAQQHETPATVKEIVDGYSDILQAYGEQYEQVQRFNAADSLIEHINDDLDLTEGRLASWIHHSAIFKRRLGDGQDLYEPHCSTHILPGLYFLGNRLVRTDVALDADDPIRKRTSRIFSRELLLVDTEAGFGVNLRLLSVMTALRLQERPVITTEYRTFLDKVSQTDQSGHVYWKKSLSL